MKKVRRVMVTAVLSMAFCITPLYASLIGSSTISYTHEVSSITSIDFQPFFSDCGTPDSCTPTGKVYFPFGWIQNINSSSIGNMFYATLPLDFLGSVALLTNGTEDVLGYMIKSNDLNSYISPITVGFGESSHLVGSGFVNPDFQGSSIGSMMITITDYSRQAENYLHFEYRIDFLASPVPEPATMLLLGLGLIGLAGIRKKE